MKEEEIRPNKLLKNQKIAMSIDVGRLLTKKDKFVLVPCPACGANNAKKKFEKYTLDYLQCINCQTIFISPRPTPEILEWFYKGSVNYDYWNKFIFPATEQNRRTKIFIPRVDKVIEYCTKYNVKNDSLLEIGCAFGTFCIELISRNYFNKVIGVEPTPALAETSRSKGIEVIQDAIENIELSSDRLFDVIVNFEVIEHLFSPKDFLQKAKKLLKVNGLLILTCPNGLGFDFIVLGDKCTSLDHEHLNYFNPRSLSNLLQSIGFEILECKTPGKLDAELVRNKILDGSFEVENQPFLKKILIEEWNKTSEAFQQFLSSSELSSNMWIVAKNVN